VPGEVFLVGTGPGDPGLLTVRALQLMQRADVVLYDRLISDDILRLVGPEALMVYVGKEKGLHTRPQEEIQALLADFAAEGSTVVRLKGGDPYIYGRGGEEAEHLEAQGVRVRCVPGITAASGIAAELGIPLTHRGVADSVRFTTGHLREGLVLPEDVAARAAAEKTTLVVYMGLSALPTLIEGLAAHGLGMDTPAAAVERGTTLEQRVVLGELGELQARVGAAGLESPTLIMVGDVVALSPHWERRGEFPVFEAGDLERGRVQAPVEPEPLLAAFEGLPPQGEALEGGVPPLAAS
jgi:uroporphyrin-III C-methyltransferase